MVEKPKQGTAPSNLIISGRYILQPEIFKILERVEKGAGGEIQLTDGMVELAKSQAFHGVRFDGRTFDCGSKLGFLTANVAFALDRPDLAPALRAEIAQARCRRPLAPLLSLKAQPEHEDVGDIVRVRARSRRIACGWRLRAARCRGSRCSRRAGRSSVVESCSGAPA